MVNLLRTVAIFILSFSTLYANEYLKLDFDLSINDEYVQQSIIKTKFNEILKIEQISEFGNGNYISILPIESAVDNVSFEVEIGEYINYSKKIISKPYFTVLYEEKAEIVLINDKTNKNLELVIYAHKLK